MSEITPFCFDDAVVRTLVIESEPWFVARDVCDILELDHITNAVSGLDEDELTVEILQSGGQNREMTIISESGLYALIFKSRKPQAKKFRRWVTHEVLPAIRKTGSYFHDQANLAGLAGQFHQASLALGAPGLPDKNRWNLASALCTALFGEDAAYLLGEKEVKAYVAALDARTRGGKYTDVAMLSLTEQGLTLTHHARLYYLEQCCTVAAGLAASERGLYQAFCQWWQHSFACGAPALELFRAMLSRGYRRFTLAGEPWYLGLEPKEDTPWQRLSLESEGKEVAL